VTSFPRTLRRALIGSASALWLALVALASPGPASAADAPPETQAYLLSPGDRVAITVFGQPELSGDFLIDGAGELLLALIGSVPAADASLGELQQRVTDRLADGYLRDPKVSVRIAEFRPIYVVGGVRLPGSYPFRHGMSVLTALALAGGFAQPEERQDSLRNETAQAEERVRAVTAAYHALLARRGRLTAQRDGAAQIAFPAALLAEPEGAELRAILDGERAIMDLQRKAHEQALAMLRQQAPRAKTEAQAIAAQRRLERVQLDLIQSQVADMSKLMNSGLARRASLAELQREEARVQGNIARNTADAARSEQVMGEIDLKIQELENGFRRQVMIELQETQVRLMETEATLDGAREARALKLQRASLAAGLPAPTGKQGAIVILSYQKDVLGSRAATETTLLKPGDIVRIEVGAPSRNPSSLPRADAAPAMATPVGLGLTVGAR